jgi:glutathione S-transferase
VSTLRLVIGNKNLSSWSLRPWILLRQAGIPFKEELRLFEAPGWRDRIRDASPSGRVPALHDGDLVVWDSLAICEYAAELHPEAGLWPADRDARAVARAVSAEMHSGFAALRKELSMDIVARVPRKTRSHETARDIERTLAIWEDCRARFGERSGAGPYLFGRFSVADAMYAPVVWRFRTYDVPVTGRAAEWYRLMLEHPAMRAWEADAEAEVWAATTAQTLPTPDPTSAQHCFAVVFSSQRRLDNGTAAAYAETADAMEELARRQPGFAGIESTRGPDGFGITVSYWDSLDAVAAWKAHPEHRRAQERGRAEFYSRYEIRVCAVERGYAFKA